MKTIALLLCGSLLLMASPQPTHAADGGGTFTPEKNKTAAALVTQSFEPVNSLMKIDPDVLVALRAVHKEDMADPGEAFQATDIVREELPFSRLVLAGKSAEMWFVLYEQGGRRPRQYLVLLTRNGAGKWQGVRAANGMTEDKTVDGLKAAVKAGEFTE